MRMYMFPLGKALLAMRFVSLGIDGIGSGLSDIECLRDL